MALPKLDVPIHELYLPLSKQKVQFRPFLVKEEKILLMAMESKDENSALLPIKQIINNCCLSDIDVDGLPVTDLEFFFLNLRARSIGEVVELQYKCNNTVPAENGEEKKCNNVVRFDVNILDIKPEIDPEHTNKIELTDKLGIVMRYPTLKMMENAKGSEVERLMDVIIDSVDYIYDDESIYYKKDVPKKELLDFIDGMTKEQFAKLQKFFETMPKIKKDVDFTCNKCGYHEKITVEGIQNFFI